MRAPFGGWRGRGSRGGSQTVTDGGRQRRRVAVLRIRGLLGDTAVIPDGLLGAVTPLNPDGDIISSRWGIMIFECLSSHAWW